MMMPPERTEEQRDELVDRVAREIHLRGLAAPAVYFLNASRPYRPLGSNAMLFFDPTLHGLFGGEVSSATELLAVRTPDDADAVRDLDSASATFVTGARSSRGVALRTGAP